MQLEGVYSVLPTPFTASGDVDDDSLRRVVDLFIGAGVNGVTALGVTGEVARLDDRERQRVLEIGHEPRQRPDWRRRRHDGRRDADLHRLQPRGARRPGATAVMVSPPRMPKLNSEAVVRHYHALAEAVDIDDRRAGLSADLGLRDGAVAARAHRARDSRARARSSSKIRRRRSRRRASSSRPRASTSASSAGSAACSCSRS